MARDDYFVIVYQVLKYLYDCLKRGEKPEAIRLQASYYSIPGNYWEYIIVNLSEEGYITGLMIQPSKDGLAFGDLQDMIITPKGIEYLFENTMIEKVKRTLKDVKEMVPFT